MRLFHLYLNSAWNMLTLTSNYKLCLLESFFIGNTLQASMDFKVVYMARLHKFCSYMHELAYISSLLKFCLWAVSLTLPVLLSIIGRGSFNVLLG